MVLYVVRIELSSRPEVFPDSFFRLCRQFFLVQRVEQRLSHCFVPVPQDPYSISSQDCPELLNVGRVAVLENLRCKPREVFLVYFP